MEEMTEQLGKLTVDSKISRECIPCDGPDCGNFNPRNRCSRCKGTYYCSVDCQRKHWFKGHKETCNSVAKNEQEEKAKAEELEEKYKAVIAQDTMSDGVQNNLALNTECCVCFADPITNDPVVLKNCRHAFCRPCLLQWQIQAKGELVEIGKKSFLGSSSFIPVPAPSEQASLCPLCKTKTDDDIYFNALTRAGLYQARADAEGGKSSEKRAEFLSKAVEELDKILNGENVRGLYYFQKKARILVDLHRGPEALECLRKMSRINDQRKKRSEEIQREIQEALTHGRTDVDILALKKELDQVNRDTIPPGGFTNSTNMLIVVDAYMSMKKWRKALEVLQGLERDRSIIEEAEQIGVMRVMHRCHDIDVRLAECLYRLKKYDKCIEAADRAIGIHRAYPRTYKWKALALHAKGKKDQALTCARRAILYESPGDSEAYEENIAFYNELVEMGVK